MPSKMKVHKPCLKRQTRSLKQKQVSNGRVLGLSSRAWRRLREFQLNRQPLCEHCFDDKGLCVVATDVDHIDNDPSNNELSNLASLCHSCHSKKTMRDMGYKPKVAIGVDGYPIDE